MVDDFSTKNHPTDKDIYIWEDSTYCIERGKPIIIIYGRNYDKPTVTREFRISGFRPYFYVPDETNTILSGVTFRGETRQDALGRRVRKVYTHIPSDVSRFRGSYEWTDEADILFDKRYLIDKQVSYAFTYENNTIKPVTVEIPLTPRICYFDIEVRSPYGVIPLPEFASYPIVTIQCMDSYTKEITIFTIDIPKIAPDQVACRDENDLLSKFANYVKSMDFDSLSGWWSNAFDLPYIINRSKRLDQGITGLTRLGIQPTCKPIETSRDYFIKCTGRQCMDMLTSYKKLSAGKSDLDDYGLKTVSKFYNFTYRDYGANIDELYNTQDYETLLEYCRNDVRALDIIDTKENMFNFFEGMRQIAGVKLEETLMNSRVIESLIMRNGIKPMPTKSFIPNEDNSYEGAIVVSPIIGLHPNVGTFDATALYPTIMLGLNISPDVDGIVVKTLSIAVEEREKLRTYRNQTGDNSKKSKENIWKYIANSFYGVIGWNRFRLYNVEQAALVTKTGRDLNIFLQKCATDRGLDIVAGDTDSVFVTGIDTPEIGLEMQQYMNNQLRDVFTPSINSTRTFEVKFEKLYSRILFKQSANGKKVAKKRYAGCIIWEEGFTCNKLSTAGGELKRSDQSLLTKQIVSDFLNTLLMEGDTEKAVNLVRDVYKSVINGKVSVHQISIPRDIKSSEHNDPWTRGLTYLHETYHETIPPGAKPRVVYLKGEKSVVIHPDLNLPDLDIDWKLTATKIIEKKMKSYIESLGYTWNSIVHGQKSIFDF